MGDSPQGTPSRDSVTNGIDALQALAVGDEQSFFGHDATKDGRPSGAPDWTRFADKGTQSRARVINRFRDQEIENYFRLFAFSSFERLLPFGALLIAIVAALKNVSLAHQREVLKVWHPMTVALSLLLFIATGLFQAFVKQSSFPNRLRRMIVYEIGVCALMLLNATNRFFDIYWREACLLSYPDVENKRATAVRYCVEMIDPYIVVGLLVPIYFLECRFVIGAPLVALLPSAWTVSVMIFKSSVTDEKIMADDVFALSVLCYSGMALCAILQLWKRDKLARDAFVNWINLKNRTADIAEQRSQVEELVQGLLPASMAQALNRGDPAFQYDLSATISVCQIHDYHRVVTSMRPVMHAHLIEVMVCCFDEAVAGRALEKVKVFGDRYITATPLQPPPRSDEPNGDELPPKDNPKHTAAKLLKFAQFQLRSTRRIMQLVTLFLNTQFPAELSLQCGMDCGSICGGIIGATSLWYEVAGEALTTARRLADTAGPKTVLLSESALNACRVAVKNQKEVSFSPTEGVIAKAYEVSVVSGKISEEMPADESKKSSSHSISSIFSSRTTAVSCPVLDTKTAPAIEPPQADGEVPLDVSVRSLDPPHRFFDSRDRKERMSVLLSRLRIPQSSYYGMDDAMNFAKKFDAEWRVGPDTKSEESTKKKKNENFRLRLTFYDSKLEEEYTTQYHEGVGTGRETFPFALAMGGLLAVVVCVEGSYTLLAVCLDGLAIGSMVLFTVYVSRNPDGALIRNLKMEILMACCWYVVPTIATYALDHSIINSWLAFVAYLVYGLISDHLVPYGWMYASTLSVLTTIICSLQEFVLRPASVERWSAFVAMLPWIVYRDRVTEGRRRQRFKVEALTKTLHQAVEGELRLQRGVLGLIVPESLVDSFALKQQAVKDPNVAVRASDFLTGLGDVTVAAIRVDDFIGRLSSVMVKPQLVLHEMELVYSTIQQKIAQNSILVDKVHTLGDVMVIAGPLYEDKALQHMLMSKAAPHVGQKYVRNGKTLDCSVAAGLALLDILLALGPSPTEPASPKEGWNGSHSTMNNSLTQSTLSNRANKTSKGGRISFVLHVDSAFAMIVGKTRPTFSVIGPATRKAEALLEASPAGSCVMTEAFRRLLRTGDTTLPRHESDFSEGPSSHWRVRGAGSTRVFPIKAPAGD